MQTGRTPTQNHRLELQKRAKGEDDEKEQALGKRNVSPFFEEMGGGDALVAAMALPVNSKSVGKRKAGAPGGKGKAARRK